MKIQKPHPILNLHTCTVGETIPGKPTCILSCKRHYSIPWIQGLEDGL